MADYIRQYPEAPTPEEIEAGYAPSTVRATPFVKFAIWTFVGLGIAYAITYGSYVALYKVQELENESRLSRLSTRQTMEFNGPRLQPSPGHDRLDFEDMLNLNDIYKGQLSGMSLWKEDPQKRSYGQAGISDAALARARTTLKNWNDQAGSQAKPQ